VYNRERAGCSEDLYSIKGNLGLLRRRRPPLNYGEVGRYLEQKVKKKKWTLTPIENKVEEGGTLRMGGDKK